MTQLKLLTIIGTRPEIIRLSRVMALLDEHLDQVIVHTGQNYDYELNEIFWSELELRKPDHFLNIDTTSLGSAVGDIMRRSEEVLKKERPDALLVLGDTNSCLAAYMARRMHIPVFHMEAGNRSFDFNVPEEVNRRIIDHIADFNLVYTEHARRHLISEGLPHRRIYLTGSPMKEVLNYYMPKIKAKDTLTGLNLEKGKYFVVSVHREKNVDNPRNLQQIITVLNRLAEEFTLPIIVSTHPRTRKRLEENKQLNNSTTQQQTTQQQTTKHLNPLLRLHPPFGYLDYINLQLHAACVISDSGTISEESSILGFPAVSIRQSMERPEAQDTGSIILTGFNPDRVIASIKLCMEQYRLAKHAPPPADYSIENTSWRVLKLITGNAGLSNIWSGISVL